MEDRASRGRASRRDRADRATVPLTVLVVLTVLLIVIWGALRAYRVEEYAAAREEHQPLPVIVRPGDEPSGRHGSPEWNDATGAGPPAFATWRRSADCVLIWVR
jgi:hypothetical protein